MNVASIDDLRNGDAAVWNRIYEELYHEAFKIVKTVLGPGFGVDWEDLAVKVIVEIMRGLADRRASFDDIAIFDDLKKRARLIAKRRALDVIRQIKSRKEDALPENYEGHLEKAESSGLDGTKSDDRESMEEFLQLIFLLPENRQDVFFDRFVEGLGHAEIAAKREMSIGTVSSHLSRGLTELRQILEEQNGRGNVK